MENRNDVTPQLIEGSVLPDSFYRQDVLHVAPLLIGMKLCRRFDDGRVWRGVITEVEAYNGEEDMACHARKGRTKRTEVMYHTGGEIYVYLIYGMYWMLNVVTGSENHPQAVLIRSAGQYDGPGKLGKALALDGSFYGESLCRSDRIWIEFAPNHSGVAASARIGVDYAGEKWSRMPWRYVLNE